MQRTHYVVKKSSLILSIAYGLLIVLAYIYPWINNSRLWMIGYITEAMLCFIYIFINSKIRLNKAVSIWFLTLFPLAINNYSVQIHEYGYILTWFFLLVLMTIAQVDVVYIKRMHYLILALCSIYAISTLMINMGFSSLLAGVANTFRGENIAQGTIYTAGLTSHYSHNGMYIAVGCLAVSSIFIMKRKKKWYDLLIMISFYAALLLTQKRGPLISVGIGVVVTFFVAKRESMSSKIKRIMAFVMSVLVITYILYIVFPELFGIIDRFSSDNVFSNRGYLWEFAIDMFKANPVMGKGWGTYSHSLNLNIDSVSVSNQHAHNIYIQLLAETGIVGLICFVIPMIYTLIKSIKMLQIMNEQNVDCSSMFMSVSLQIFFMVYGITGNPLYDKQMILVYMLSVAFYLSYRTIHREWTSGKQRLFSGKEIV